MVRYLSPRLPLLTWCCCSDVALLFARWRQCRGILPNVCGCAPRSVMVLKKLGEDLSTQLALVAHFLGKEMGLTVVVEEHEHAALAAQGAAGPWLETFSDAQAERCVDARASEPHTATSICMRLVLANRRRSFAWVIHRLPCRSASWLSSSAQQRET